jgi:hypothetical protein
MLIEITAPTGARRWVPLASIAFIESGSDGDVENCVVIGHDGKQLGTVSIDEPSVYEMIAKPKRQVIPAQPGYTLLWCRLPDDTDIDYHDIDLNSYVESQEIIGWKIHQLNDGGMRMPITLDETTSLIYITLEFAAISSPNGQVIDYRGRQFESVDDWMAWVKQEYHK